VTEDAVVGRLVTLVGLVPLVTLVATDTVTLVIPVRVRPVVSPGAAPVSPARRNPPAPSATAAPAASKRRRTRPAPRATEKTLSARRPAKP
jgi:hypothetical protein